ncbi:hypothetical protein NDA16_004670 [Ustilago loliicola]|nr:hypothetical protein NDA16_004670 [Ustilago loliicola]
MLFTKPSNVAALVGAAAVLTTKALATPTILLPCGKGANSEAHAIVPDANCQKFSDTGAFTISNLGDIEPGVELAFSATPDCQATFIAPHHDLVKLQESSICQAYVVVGKGEISTNNGVGPGQEPKVGLVTDAKTRVYGKQEDADERKVDKRDGASGDWTGFWIKRHNSKGEDKEQQYAAGTQNAEKEGTQTALTYVMLVEA